MRRAFLQLLHLLLFLCPALAMAGGPEPRLADVRWSAKPDFTRIVFEFAGGEPAYRLYDEQAREGYLYIDFHGASLAGMGDENVPFDLPRLKSIRRRSFPRPHVLRFIIDTERVCPAVVIPLSSPSRVVVDLYDPGKAPPDAKNQPARGPEGSSYDGPSAVPVRSASPFPSAAAAPSRGGRPLKIILDPGHGGKDPGALSRVTFNGRKAREKDLALDIAQEVRKMILADPTLSCEMTRETDAYVSLQERVEFSESRRADLFLSLHLNAAPSTAASGPEFYYLNERGQRQLRDRIVKSSGAVGRSKDIIERMASARVEASNRQSRRFCELMDASFDKVDYYKARNRGVKTANFYVLKNAGTPSALVEVAFMTNATDVRRHYAWSGKREAARRIYEAIKDYQAETGGS